MRKRFLLFGITLAAMLTSCYGPDDSVYTEDLDVVYSQKKDSYDFTSKVNYFVSDTITYFDSKGKLHKSPDTDGFYHEDIPKNAVDALTKNVRVNMEYFNWNEVSISDVESDPETYAENTVFMNVIVSKTTYVGGGYYPGYPGWGYPGYWYPWVPYYYSYSTGSVAVNMFQVNTNPKPNEGGFGVVWETFLSGYVRNGIDIPYVNKGITQGFQQSQEYLQK